MAKIIEMPPHLRDLIAAGEVVERPGSVVKELVENSIDAGATTVTVEIQNGGMSLIRVTDNGCGMAPEDAETAFLRHATSKLQDERGLEAIGTLGFRGEALAAIAAVSRIELTTRERDAVEGTRLTLEGGIRTDLGPAGAPEGTVITVRDLFFNTPARLKFMKNDRAEGSNVTTTVVRLALSHPEVSFRYLRDGKEELHTPGDGRTESAVYCVLGRDLAQGLLPAKGEADGIRCEGFVSAPAGARGNRAYQFFFVNGRFIRSKTLQAALEQAYKNSLFTGRFPVCVLKLEMGLSRVDVNVHPTKMEVRFADERAAFNAVYWAARTALDKETKPVTLELPKELLKGSAPAEKASSGAPASGNAAFRPNASPTSFGVGVVKPRDGFFKTMTAESFRSASGGFAPKAVQTAIPLPKTVPPPPEPTFSSEPEPAPVDIPAPKREATPSDAMDFRLIGEAMCTYLIVERGDSLFLIDKHAAHERILFDRLKAQKREIASQILLTPAVCQVGEAPAEILLESAELLGEFGFVLEDFGGGAVALRQVPQDMDAEDPQALLEELADKLRMGGRRDLESMRDEVLHTVACKAAIKAGKRSDPREVRELITRVLSGEVRYCPHGRPVSVELTKTQLDKSFRRV